MTREYCVGSFLLDELHARGVEHIFGVPGDYILRFNKMIEEHPIHFINATRENTAGYMADAYARIKGLGVVCVTYGVGLNLVNAVSQSFMENSPLVLISGAPAAHELKRSHFLHHLIHKSAGPYENTQHEILKPITAYQAVLQNASTAYIQIKNALDIAMSEKKPVYIELPRNMVLEPMPSTLGASQVKRAPLKALEAELQTFLKNAKRPFIWVGHEVQRKQLAAPILDFAEKWSIPILTTLLGKTVLDERHPLVYGVYQGDLSHPRVVDLVNQCDAALVLGVIQNDIETGIFTARIPQMNHLSYSSESLPSAINALKKVHLSASFPAPAKNKSEKYKVKNESSIRVQTVFDILQTQITEDLIWIADVGDCLFGASDLVLPQDSFLSNAYFSSLGFAVPGSIGASLTSPQKRVVCLVGDGAFQMTGMELSTAVRYNLNPIVILFNNKGYGTERPILDGAYNDLVNWRYTVLPELLKGGKSRFVQTEGQFLKAFTEAVHDKSQYHLIEVNLDLMDFSDAGKRFGQVVSQSLNSGRTSSGNTQPASILPNSH